MKIRTNLLAVVRGIIILAVATLLIAIQGASAATTDNQVPNEQLLNKNVRHALVMIPYYGVFDNLEYSVNGTTVVLSGQVVEPVRKSDAESAVKHVQGVTNVVNNINVLPLSSFDSRIRRAEYRSIFSDSVLGRYSMGAIPCPFTSS